VYQYGVYERYAYDGDGRRIIKESRSASDGGLIRQHTYRYDDVDPWNVIHQTTEAMAATTHTDYVYDQPMHKLAYQEGDTTQYFQNDALGSVMGTTDADGNAPDDLMRYGDYGELDGPERALPTDDAYTGYERDAYTGLYYARNRYYDAATGMVLSVDPYPVNQADLLDLHRYLYVQANPINRIDPQGLFFKELFNKAKEKVGQVVDAVRRIFKKKPRPKPDIKPRPIPPPDPNIQGEKTPNIPDFSNSSKSFTSNKTTLTKLQGQAPTTCGMKPEASIGGIVTDAKTGNPIYWAKVKICVNRHDIFTLCSYNQSNIAYTSIDGKYLITNITFSHDDLYVHRTYNYWSNCQNYNIQITKSNYLTHNGIVKVTKGKKAIYSAALSPKDNEYQIKDNDERTKRLECYVKKHDYIDDCEDKCDNKGKAFEYIGATGGALIGLVPGIFDMVPGDEWMWVGGGTLAGEAIGNIPADWIRNRCKDKCEEEGDKIYSECIK
jgi:RHS repeat-associated protein